jgi:hypothetical protein
LRVILRVEKVSSLIPDSGNPFMVVINLEIFSLIGESGVSVSDSPSGIPVDWESFSLGTVEDLVRVG